MTAQLSDAALELLASSAVATVVTLDPDGSPRMSVAWVGLEDGEIVIGTLGDQAKLRNLRRDPRIALTIQGDRINAWGLREYLVIDGNARVTEGGAPELLQRLARTYLGPDVVFPAMPDPPPGFVTRVRIDRVSGIGPWGDEARRPCLVRDLPDLAGGIAEAGGPHAPRPIDRAVQQGHAAGDEICAGRVDVVDRDRELQPGARIR